jgi:hypothetical protein
MTNFEGVYGKIDKNVVEKTESLTKKLMDINIELRDLKIPIRVYAKTTKKLKDYSKDNQLYFKDTVDISINLSSEF